MKRVLAVCLAVFCCAGFAAAADEKPALPDEKSDGLVYDMNQKGDQFIRMSLFVDVPINPSTDFLFVGGSGTLGFYSFLNSSFAVGGDFSFTYSSTIGSNVYYFVPMMARAMYQFTAGKFEIPLFLGIGGSFQSYVDRFYFGLTINPEIGVFYRFTPEWSFGATAGCYILPQWVSTGKWTGEYDYTGVIMDFGLTVRYHF